MKKKKLEQRLIVLRQQLFNVQADPEMPAWVLEEHTTALQFEIASIEATLDDMKMMRPFRITLISFIIICACLLGYAIYKSI